MLKLVPPAWHAAYSVSLVGEYLFNVSCVQSLDTCHIGLLDHSTEMVCTRPVDIVPKASYYCSRWSIIVPPLSDRVCAANTLTLY
jgi:hypothetical protein